MTPHSLVEVDGVITLLKNLGKFPTVTTRRHIPENSSLLLTFNSVIRFHFSKSRLFNVANKLIVLYKHAHKSQPLDLIPNKV
jgi:hypothetical protein